MSIETLIKTGFSDVFRDETWQECSAGKLLSPEFKKNMTFGDEVIVKFDGMVTLIDYTGGDLKPDDAEDVTETNVKIKINKGCAVYFKLDDAKLKQIENAKSNEERIKIVKKYANDTKEQFARKINKACCEQYVRAGKRIEGANGEAITVTSENVHKLFAKAKALLKQGDGKGHTAWREGQMLAIISTEMEAFMSTQNLLQYSDTMAKTYKNGYSGRFMGFDVIVDDDVATDSDGNEYPLFGRSKKTIAGGIQHTLELKSGTPVGGFDTRYWGRGIFGLKAPLSYLLCTAKLKVDFKVA